jgi:DNA-binding NarL/FixJ family response regulator
MELEGREITGAGVMASIVTLYATHKKIERASIFSNNLGYPTGIALPMLSCVGCKEMPPIRIAISQKQRVLHAALKQILGDTLAAPKDDTPAAPDDDSQSVVGLVFATDSDGTDWANHGATIFKQHPKCIGLVVVTPNPTKLEQPDKPDKLAPRLRAAFDTGVQVVDSKTSKCLLEEILQSVAHFRNTPAPDSAMHIVREMTFAASLYRHISRFGHGATRDLTNQVLAPLRIFIEGGGQVRSICSKWKERASNLMKEFECWVVKKCDSEWWLAGELSQAFDEIHESWKSSNPPDPRILSRLMDLLTECRVLAGARPMVSASAPDDRVDQIDAQESEQNWPYQILVIDDHSMSWHPVFESVQKRLAEKTEFSLPAEFTFRTGGESDLVEARGLLNDAKSLEDDAQRREAIENAKKIATAVVLQQITSHDAVLLDIHLPSPLNGIELLKEVRRHSVNVPIIVWTSSRAPELPADAQLAHGFLFKKTATLESMAEMIHSRLLEGNAKRRYPLPGHFFDHSLRERVNRKAALRMAEYCSKQMDSFHALDDGYFRYFTDHGGRHLFKLVEYLGDMLRHLVIVPGVFSQDKSEREEEILALYLAVFLHEFGMLRLNGPHEPNWERLIHRAAIPKNVRSLSKLKRELALVRALHAVRGMVMLAKEPPKDAAVDKAWHWPDEEGCHQALKRLWEGEGRTPYLRSAVALITGHNSRLLPLNLDDGKGWNHNFSQSYLNKAEKALKLGGVKLTRQLDRRFYSPEEVHQTLTDLLGTVCNGRLERVRKHCAVFRFVDAMDVDQSRNPARFLCRIKMLSEFDRRETLKRQVIRHVRIEAGRVSMETNVPPPELEVVKKILVNQAKDGESLAEWSDLKTWIADPWNTILEIGDIHQPECVHKAIDDWLADFWEKPKEMQASFLDFSNPESTRESKMHIASLTALSVAGEILSEYRAIFECDLQMYVTLGAFWRDKPDPPDWQLHQEKMLSILFHPEDGLDFLIQ